MAISFEAIDGQYVTFAAAADAAKDAVCKITANGTVGACDDGDAFCGVCEELRGGAAAVQMGGYAELRYSGDTAPALGYVALAADGTGGVKAATSGGRSCLVVRVDSTGKTVGVFL